LSHPIFPFRNTINYSLGPLSHPLRSVRRSAPLSMDFFRRLHQSYPPRPSPLSNSQESRDDGDRPRTHASSSTSAATVAAAAAAAATSTTASTVGANESRNRPEDKIRLGSRYEYPPPSSSHSHPYGTGSRGSHRVRRETTGTHISPPRNQTQQSHRRHASLESRQQGHVHRRNHSQPQTGHTREGR
jgi:hypothetical protein